MGQGASIQRAETKNFNALLPDFRKKDCECVSGSLKAVSRKFMEKNDMDFEEAAGAAIEKRKYLLNKTFNPLRPNNDLSQTSHCNIKGLSVSEVMRIENMITQVQFY